MSANTNPVLGVVVLTRHGDRQGFYQSPTTYTATATSITPLGEAQEFQLGQSLRSRYLDPTSPNLIKGISGGLFNGNQVNVMVDAGGEGGVIFDSAVASLQGLWPATTANNVTLANSTTIISPLGGYQYVPIDSVQPTDSILFEGWTQCPAFDSATSATYASASFKQKASDNQAFLNGLQPIVGNRSTTLENAYNIFDFMNVQSIHNSTFANSLPAGTLQHIRDLANYHEYVEFASSDLGGVQNMAIRTLLPDILTSLQQFTNATNQQKILYLGASYKPFVSLFAMTGASDADPTLRGIVDYASALTLEVRQSSTNSTPGAYDVRLNFKNGTQDADFRTLNMFGNAGVDSNLDDFVSRLSPYGIPDDSTWCQVCSTTTSRSCGLISSANLSTTYADANPVTSRDGVHMVSPLAAGFIGAGVTLAFVAIVMTFAGVMGWVGVGKGRKGRRSVVGDSDSQSGLNRHDDKASA